MMKIAICAITFKRPDGLAALLDSLATLTFAKLSPKPELVIVITDNDPACSARSICEQKRAQHGYSLIYASEPEQGIPLARNKGMASIPEGFDYAAWVDDDETVAPYWLEELLLCAQETGAQLVSGPVNALYPDNTAKWLIDGGFFNRKPWPDRATLPMAATNNLLIHIPSWQQSGLRFDERLRYTGSSDTLMSMTAIRTHGWKIIRAAQADVYEVQPASRLTAEWIIQRQYRVGNGLTICAVLLDGWLKAAPIRTLKAAGNVAYGVALILRGIIKDKQIDKVKGKSRIARGAGIFSALFGHRYAEYAPKRLPGS
jgi:glycosyltransferase involved in cell wall biosynthesis